MFFVEINDENFINDIRNEEYMKRLLILGAGQYGFAVKEIAEAIGKYDAIEFLDDNNPIAVGKLSDVDKLGNAEAIVAIGNPAVRKALSERIARPATLIHPKATVSPSANVGVGCIVEAGAVICASAEVGKGTLVMANAVVGHNATVGEFCQLKYNASIAERASVPSATKIECNTVVSAEN